MPPENIWTLKLVLRSSSLPEKVSPKNLVFRLLGDIFKTFLAGRPPDYSSNLCLPKTFAI